MVNTNTQKQSRSKKLVGPDGSCVGGHHEQNRTCGCGDFQTVSCKESSPFEISSKRHIAGNKCSRKDSSLDCNDNSDFGEDGLACVRRSNLTSHAKLDQAGLQNENDDIDADGNTSGSETHCASFMKFDQKLGKEFNPSSNQHEIDWSASTSLQHKCNYITNQSSMRACRIDTTASPSIGGEDNQLIEGNCYDCYVPCGGGLHYKAFLREKFFSTRYKQHTTIHQQKLMIHHHKSQYCDAPTSNISLDHANHDDMQNRSRICSNDYTNPNNRREHVDAALLATETANLLERLLPLVADPDTMKSFISNLETRSPRPSPRDQHTHNQRYLHHLCKETEQSGTRRLQGTDQQTLIGHELDKSDRLLEETNNMNDDGSVLAELEEAVGRTVDDILRRYILISPAPRQPPPPQQTEDVH